MAQASDEFADGVFNSVKTYTDARLEKALRPLVDRAAAQDVKIAAQDARLAAQDALIAKQSRAIGLLQTAAELARRRRDE